MWFTDLIDGQWSEPKQLSPSGSDCRNPTLVRTSQSMLYVNYEDWTASPVVVRCGFIKETFDP